MFLCIVLLAIVSFIDCDTLQEQTGRGDCHVYKWWGVAALRGDQSHWCTSVPPQFDMEQKLVRLESIVCDLGRKKSRFGNGFELVVALVVVLVIIAFE
ncbi:hypothetical protein Bca52824_056643 [Brassica carinata]|uniref:Uncharacterized protein n=1 Tax=Brassica carinata TaxID=52824 RepID=A0A8X7QPJ1_BRACI|nr:hypothetical protein Bca52824_056643 [Brassica carinata]